MSVRHSSNPLGGAVLLNLPEISCQSVRSVAILGL